MAMICARCHELRRAGTLWRCACGGPLALEPGRPPDPARVNGRAPTMWRYREALAVAGEPVSLGEPMTPLIAIEHEGRSGRAEVRLSAAVGLVQGPRRGGAHDAAAGDRHSPGGGGLLRQRRRLAGRLRRAGRHQAHGLLSGVGVTGEARPDPPSRRGASPDRGTPAARHRGAEGARGGQRRVLRLAPLAPVLPGGDQDARPSRSRSSAAGALPTPSCARWGREASCWACGWASGSCGGPRSSTGCRASSRCRPSASAPSIWPTSGAPTTSTRPPPAHLGRGHRAAPSRPRPRSAAGHPRDGRRRGAGQRG